MLEPKYIEFSKPGSFSDCSALCVVLVEECNEVAGSLGYPDEDARSVALRNASHMAGAAAMILNVLDTGAKSSEEAVRAMLGVSTGPVQIAADDLDKFARLGLVTLVQFQIENLLANIVRAHGGSPRRTYTALVDQTMNAFYANNVGRAKNTLVVPAWIRNTLHNNRIHEGPNARVQVHGHRFTFRAGHKFSQAGWGKSCTP